MLADRKVEVQALVMEIPPHKGGSKPSNRESQQQPHQQHKGHPTHPRRGSTDRGGSKDSPKSKSSTPKPAPEHVGPYLLGKTLGKGSSGCVKLARHRKTNEQVAVKIISKASLANKAAVHRGIEREIAIMKLIKHPHVIRLYDVYETEKELFLVMEYVSGGELFEYLVNKGRLEEAEALRFFQQIIVGLAFCHKRKICHRDLKPENLLLDDRMNVKIADFGMASLQKSGRLLETSCGSPHYASPEVVTGLKYDGSSSDIWSCGIILYALLTGHLPFDDENIRQLLSKVKAGKFYMPMDISPGARDLISRMLTVNPKRRITMQGVMMHPWFRMVNPERNTLGEPAEDPESGRPLLAEELDAEIILHMRWLFAPGPSHSDPEAKEVFDEEALLREIEEKMTNSSENMEKLFYHLLCQHKMELLENYSGDDNDLGPDGKHSDDAAAYTDDENATITTTEPTQRHDISCERDIEQPDETMADSTEGADLNKERDQEQEINQEQQAPVTSQPDVIAPKPISPVLKRISMVSQDERQIHDSVTVEAHSGATEGENVTVAIAKEEESPATQLQSIESQVVSTQISEASFTVASESLPDSTAVVAVVERPLAFRSHWSAAETQERVESILKELFHSGIQLEPYKKPSCGIKCRFEGGVIDEQPAKPVKFKIDIVEKAGSFASSASIVSNHSSTSTSSANSNIISSSALAAILASVDLHHYFPTNLSNGQLPTSPHATIRTPEGSAAPGAGRRASDGGSILSSAAAAMSTSLATATIGRNPLQHLQHHHQHHQSYHMHHHSTGSGGGSPHTAGASQYGYLPLQQAPGVPQGVVKVTLNQQQGANSTLKVIFEKLLVVWEQQVQFHDQQLMVAAFTVNTNTHPHGSIPSEFNLVRSPPPTMRKTPRGPAI
ncbi:hypothetical protein BGZ68_003011 [Mortierella alpina]|nr:hypothetical protein BGZ68_003011 [Mortierella alpina]